MDVENLLINCTEGPSEGYSFEIDSATIKVGRDTFNEIVIDDEGLSKIHFVLEWHDNVLSMYDNDSSNGVWLNGDEVSEGTLDVGSIIEAGNSTFVISSNSHQEVPTQIKDRPKEKSFNLKKRNSINPSRQKKIIKRKQKNNKKKPIFIFLLISSIFVASTSIMLSTSKVNKEPSLETKQSIKVIAINERPKTQKEPKLPKLVIDEKLNLQAKDEEVEETKKAKVTELAKSKNLNNKSQEISSPKVIEKVVQIKAMPLSYSLPDISKDALLPRVLLAGGGDRPFTDAFNGNKTLPWKEFTGNLQFYEAPITEEKWGLLLDQYSLFLVIKNTKSEFQLSMKGKSQDFVNVKIKKNSIEINGHIGYYGSFHKNIDAKGLQPDRPVLISFRPYSLYVKYFDPERGINKTNGEFRNLYMKINGAHEVSLLPPLRKKPLPVIHFDKFFSPRSNSNMTMTGIKNFKGRVGELRIYQGLNDKQQIHIESELIKYWSIERPAKNHFGKTTLGGSKSKSQELFLKSFPAATIQGGGDRPLRAAFKGIHGYNIHSLPPFWRKLRGKSALNKKYRLNSNSVFVLLKSRDKSFGLFTRSSGKYDDFTNVTIEKNGIRINGKTDRGGKFHRLFKCNILKNEPILLSFRPNGKSCIVKINGQFSGTIPSSLNVRQFGSAYAAQGPFTGYSDFTKERQFGYASYTDNAKGDLDGDFAEIRVYSDLNEEQQSFVEEELIEYWKLKGAKNGFEVGFLHKPSSGGGQIRQFTSGNLTLHSLKKNPSKMFIGQSEIIRWLNPENLPDINLRAKHTWRLQNEITKKSQQFCFSFDKKMISQLPVNKGYYVLLYKRNKKDAFTILAKASANKDGSLVFPQIEAVNGYYTLGIKGENYSSHPNTILANASRAEGIVELESGQKMKISASRKHRAFIRIYEKMSGILWYEGLSSKLDLSSRLIRNEDIPLIVEYAAQPGFKFTRHEFTIRSVNDSGLYLGLKARYILASGLPKSDAFVYSRQSQAASLNDKTYSAYPAFRSAESAQSREGKGNFNTPDYYHRPITSFNTATKNMDSGTAVSISGKIIIEQDGWYRFRARSFLAMRLSINEKTREQPKPRKGKTLHEVELTFKLKRGLHDFNLIVAGGGKHNLQMDWIGPGDKKYKELRGDDCLYLVSPQVERAYRKFSQRSIKHKSQRAYQGAFSKKKLYIKNAVLDDLTEGYRTEQEFTSSIQDLLTIWRNDLHHPSSIYVAKKILTTIQSRISFFKKYPSQHTPSKFILIDGDLVKMFQRLRTFMKTSMRHPHLQKQALSTQVDILWYLEIIFSRPFFSEFHTGTNDCYQMNNNFVVNVWRAASIWDNPIAYDHARSLMDHHYSFPTKYGPGMHADNIYCFHARGSRHIYMGEYGAHWLTYISSLKAINWGTPWAKTQRQLDRLAKQLLAREWFFYKGTAAFSTSGKKVSVHGGFGSKKTIEYLKLPKEGGLSQAVREQLQEQKERLKTGGTLSGNRFFYRHLQMMHRRKDYYLDVRMSAPAVSGNETIFGLKNSNTSFADGVTTLMRHGDEYNSINQGSYLPKSLWRFRALPGTTQLDTEEGIPGLDLDDRRGSTRTGKGSRAGGVSDGEFGHCAFEFNHITKARKFFAFTEDGMHVLANGIIGASKAPKGSTYRTNINQCSLQKKVNILQTKKGEINGRKMTIAYNEEKEIRLPLDKSCWIEHNGIGYIVYPRVGYKRSSLVIRTSKRTPINRLPESVWKNPTEQMLAYKDICEELLNQSTPRETMVLEIYIDHGDFPKGKGANCSYFVCMRPEKKKAEEWLKNPPVKVLSNTRVVQAVRDNENGTIHAFFYKKGELKGPGHMSLITKQPASIMLRKKQRGSSSSSTYKSEKSSLVSEGPWHLYAQDPLVNCTFDTKLMSDYLDLKVRFPNTGTLSTHKLKLPMAGHADPDDRYRGGITVRVFEDK